MEGERQGERERERGRERERKRERRGKIGSFMFPSSQEYQSYRKPMPIARLRLLRS